MIELTTDQYKKLYMLARRALHIGCVWNDHNFEHPTVMVREEMEKLGLMKESNMIAGRDNANKFLSSLPNIPLEETEA